MIVIEDSTIFLESFLVKTAQYGNPTDFILAVIFNEDKILRKELRVSDILNEDDLRSYLVNIFDVLEKLWKLGMVYNHPEIPNKELNKNSINHQFLWESVSTKLKKAQEP